MRGMKKVGALALTSTMLLSLMPTSALADYDAAKTARQAVSESAVLYANVSKYSLAPQSGNGKQAITRADAVAALTQGKAATASSDFETTVVAPAEVAEASATEDPAVVASEEVVPSTYVVQEGDSLWNIAMDRYGTAEAFQSLVEVNSEYLDSTGGILETGHEITLLADTEYVDGDQSIVVAPSAGAVAGVAPESVENTELSDANAEENADASAIVSEESTDASNADAEGSVTEESENESDEQSSDETVEFPV